MNSINLRVSLDEILAELNLPHTTKLAEKILAYLHLLEQWNRVYNLTAIADPYERLVKHIADSLSVAPYISSGSWLDVGSGAGLPGIPLAIYFPHIQWILLDSHSKKTHFLVQVKASLGLDNIAVVQARVEDYVPTMPIDHVITRAWTSLQDMITKTQHLAKTGTKQVWAMKGIYPAQELAEISQLYEVHRLKVPKLIEERHLVKVNIEKR